MSRLVMIRAGAVIALATLGLPAEARADNLPEAEVADQSIGAELGIAAGGRVTAGGLRLAGHYLYQLSDQDWFDGTASFTFGGGGAACFRDRDNALVCDHGLAAGRAVEIAVGIRRMFTAQGDFRPFARVAIGAALVRFGGDRVSGLAVPVHAGGGVRARIRPSIHLVAQAELAFGFGLFNRSLGAEPQLGLAIGAGAEFDLR